MGSLAELLIIKDQHELACHSMSCGLASEEAGEHSEALLCFRKCHLHLSQGLDVVTEGKRCQGESWDEARQVQQKMKEMLRTVTTHLSNLEKSQPTMKDSGGSLDCSTKLYPDLENNRQPANSSVHHMYPAIPEKAVSTSPTPIAAPVSTVSPAIPNTQTLPEAAVETVVMDNPDLPPAYTPVPTDGHHSLAYDHSSCFNFGGAEWKELLLIPSGVQLFFVDPNGEVTSLSQPSYLRITALDGHHDDSSAANPTGVLQVCDFVCPLKADSPVLLANSGIYMFPDYMSEIPGSYIGLVLSSELPTADHEMFQDLISQLADLRIQELDCGEAEVVNLSTKVPFELPNEQAHPKSPEQEKPLLPAWSEKLSEGILSGATRLSESLVKSAESTGNLIQKGAAMIRQRIVPEETPSKVSPQTTKHLERAKVTTEGAVRVSKFLVNGMSTLAGRLAEKMAPHVKKQGAKLVPEAWKNSQEGRPSKLDGAKFVAASSVQGFSAVWSSLESGAKHVCKSIASETVSTVKYKYGEDAAKATDTALLSAGNIGLTLHNIDNMGIKAFLKTASKETAKVVINKEQAETKEKIQTPAQHTYAEGMDEKQPAPNNGEDVKKEE